MVGSALLETSTGQFRESAQRLGSATSLQPPVRNCVETWNPITKGTTIVPRYLVERTFPEGLNVPMNDAGATAMGGVIARNAEKGVTWVQSFVSPDKSKSFCIYDAPSPEAIRSTAQKNSLPVDKITEVRVLDPYFYR
jgi:hypothetical protein